MTPPNGQSASNQVKDHNMSGNPGQIDIAEQAVG